LSHSHSLRATLGIPSHLSVILFALSLSQLSVTDSFAEEVNKTRATEAPPELDSTSEGEMIVTGQRPRPEGLQERATERVNERRLREQLPQSTPEALHGMMGVYVQQTAHGQASVFIRGRTGRHTLLMSDGFRLNHALFRQGPNQYLFTIDPLSVRSIDVLRGGGSVWLGANALSGAVLVHGQRPSLRHRGVLKAGLTTQYSTADRGLVGRLESTWQPAERWGLYVALGGLTRGELKASGPLPSREDLPELLKLEKEVPRFREDGQTQMGTGYDALSADLVSRYRTPSLDLTAGLRLFRQYDAPRTDQCPPPEAPETWCLRYDEQFRTHAFVRGKLKLRRALLHHLQLGLSAQRQHERRTNDRVQYQNTGRDAVNVWEARVSAQSSSVTLLGAQGRLHYGLDSSYEQVSSRAWDTLARSGVTREASRGQYLDGSEYLRGGLWSGARWRWLIGDSHTLTGRVGSRLSVTHAMAPADPSSESLAVDRGWRGATYGGGLSWSPRRLITVLMNIEQGFATPNLDDLTARQLTGQGFQIENPSLGPERSLTYELGLKLTHARATFEGWLFAMELTDGIERRDSGCPMSDLACQGSRTARPFTLINLSEPAWIYGAEQRLTLRLPLGFSVEEQLSYAVGEGPSPLRDEAGQGRPLSRVPPLNGGVIARWEGSSGLYLGYELRWALRADRLSFGDELDSRIPFGGTPGYQVHRALFGARWRALGLELLGVVDNLTDTPYRVHGSSVNGATRGLSLSLRYTPQIPL